MGRPARTEDMVRSEDFAPDPRLEAFERMSRILDTQFRIPVLNIPIGWDAILGLIPGVGALITVVPMFFMARELKRRSGRNRDVARMIGNAGVDMVLGSVPVVGDIADVFFKSHRRNMTILREHALRQGR